MARQGNEAEDGRNEDHWSFMDPERQRGSQEEKRNQSIAPNKICVIALDSFGWWECRDRTNSKTHIHAPSSFSAAWSRAQVTIGILLFLCDLQWNQRRAGGHMEIIHPNPTPYRRGHRSNEMKWLTQHYTMSNPMLPFRHYKMLKCLLDSQKGVDVLRTGWGIYQVPGYLNMVSQESLIVYQGSV